MKLKTKLVPLTLWCGNLQHLCKRIRAQANRCLQHSHVFSYTATRCMLLLFILAFFGYAFAGYGNIFDLNEGNYTALWNGNNAGDKIGDTNDSDIGVMLVNLDGNLIANDLLIIAPYASTNGRTNNGAIYLIKDIASKSGALDLNNLSSFDAVWTGASSNDNLGATFDGNLGVQVIHKEGTSINDLLVTASNASTQGRTSNGAVYLLRGVASLSGVKDLSIVANFSVRWDGAVNYDYLGRTSVAPTKLGSGKGVQFFRRLGDWDQDLIITAVNALNDGVTSPNNGRGAVYLIIQIYGLPEGGGEIRDLNNSTNYTAMWSGVTQGDHLGDTSGSKQGVQLINADHDQYPDMIINAVNMDANGKVDNGAIYYINNIYTISGSRPLEGDANYTAAWFGADSGARLGYTYSSGQGVQVVDVDNNSYTIDLLLTAPDANAGEGSQNGALYIVRDINSITGSHDLNNSASFTARWFGGSSGDRLGSTNGSGTGVQLVNADGNSWANDLIITASNADVNGKINNGAVYLIKDINTVSGDYNLLGDTNFGVAWNGASSNDLLGSASIDNNSSGNGTIFFNSIGTPNSILISAAQASIGADKNENGAIYFIRDINLLSGWKDLNSSGDYNAVWFGDSNNSHLGFTNGSCAGMQVVNIDGNSFADDLLLSAVDTSTNNKTNNGAVYLIKDISTRSGQLDLNNSANYAARWFGSNSGDKLGETKSSQVLGCGVQTVSFFGLSHPNNLLITASNASMNSKTNNGAVYLINDVNGLNGNFDLNVENNFDSLWTGAGNGDLLAGVSGLGTGVSLANVSANAYSNDLFLLASNADVNTKSDNGAFYFITNLRVMPDVNLNLIDGNNLATFNYFSYAADGNLSLDFNVSSALINNLLLDINYSSTQAIKTGTSIFQDLNLSALPTTGPLKCASTNFRNSVKCVIEWNSSSILDGNYYIIIALDNGNSVVEKAFPLLFGSDNNAPSTAISGCTTTWNKTAQTISLSCNKGTGSDCNSSSYRLDSGDWNYFYSSPFSLSTNGNHQIDYYSRDVKNNVEATKTAYCGIDFNAPIMSSPSPSSATNTTSTTPSLSVTVTDATSGVASCTVTPIINGIVSTPVSVSYSSGACTYTPAARLVGETIAASFIATDNATNVTSSSVTTATYTIISSSSTGTSTSGSTTTTTITPTITPTVTVDTNVFSLTNTFSFGDVNSALLVKRTATRTVSTGGIYTFKLNVRNISSKALSNITMRVTIPKKVVTDQNALTFSPSISRVIQRDPVIEWDINSLALGVDKNFTYTATTLADSNVDGADFNAFFLNAANWGILFRKTPADLCSDVNCNDSNSCTTDTCLLGVCTHTQLTTSNCLGETDTNEPSDTNQSGSATNNNLINNTTIMIAAIIIIIIVVIIGVIAFTLIRKKKKEKPFVYELPKEGTEQEAGNAGEGQENDTEGSTETPTDETSSSSETPVDETVGSSETRTDETTNV